MPKMTLSLVQNKDLSFKKECSKCKEDKVLISFYFRKDRGSFGTICKSCISESAKAKYISKSQCKYNTEYYRKNKDIINKNKKYRIKNTLSGRLKFSLSNARARSDKKGWDFDLDYNYLFNLYKEQDGVCAVTLEPLTLSGGRNSSQLSIDRIDSSRGYIKGNIRLVTTKINLFIKDLSDEELITICKLILRGIG